MDLLPHLHVRRLALSSLVHPTQRPTLDPTPTFRCAVIGGVFTVFGMVVAMLDTSSEAFAKKSI